jgi:hypothetical protein
MLFMRFVLKAKTPAQKNTSRSFFCVKVRMHTRGFVIEYKNHKYIIVLIFS